jgi:hypothetical protein
MPDCTFEIDLMGEWSYGCTQFAVYHFNTLVRPRVRVCSNP